MPDRIRRATVVVNKQSGTVLENSRKDLEQQFREPSPRMAWTPRFASSGARPWLDNGRCQRCG